MEGGKDTSTSQRRRPLRIIGSCPPELAAHLLSSTRSVKTAPQSHRIRLASLLLVRTRPAMQDFLWRNVVDAELRVLLLTRTSDHLITGHSVWSTAFIRSSFIRPPYTSILERAVSISRRSAGVS